jgi:hypothetical protein
MSGSVITSLVLSANRTGMRLMMIDAEEKKEWNKYRALRKSVLK